MNTDLSAIKADEEVGAPGWATRTAMFAQARKAFWGSDVGLARGAEQRVIGKPSRGNGRAPCSPSHFLRERLPAIMRAFDGRRGRRPYSVKGIQA